MLFRSYDEDSGEYCFVFDCTEWMIFAPDAYEVAVRATAEATVGDKVIELFSGLQETVFKIAYGNNQDTNGDGSADNNIDKDNDGVIEETATLVNMNVAIDAVGADTELTFTLSSNGRTVVPEESITVTKNEDGTYALSLAMGESVTEGLYTLTISKVGYTSYTITDVPVDRNSANTPIELGTATLYVGDFDGNDQVDFLDFDTILGNMNAFSDVQGGDTDGNGVVNFLDLDTVLGNMNKRSATVSYTKN